SEADIARAGRSGVFVAEDRTRAAFAHRARHGGVRAELPMRRGTGEVFTADVASTLFMTDEGELRATTIFRDATERVRAQEQLARQRDRLALLHLVSTAINQATDMDEAVRETLDPVGEATGWPVGDVMLLGDDGIIRPSPIWRIADAERFGWFRGWVVSMSLPAGEGLAGRVIAS